MLRGWDVLQNQLRSGLLGRRQFLAAAAALGVAGNLVETALAQTAKRGGNLIIGINQASSADSLDPALWSKEYEYAIGYQLFDTLTFVNEKFELKPSLAENWETKTGAKEWVIKLRKDVTFHNGKKMTPADVVFSLNHHRNPKSMGRSMVSAFEDVKATGPNEVTITLNSGNADLPYFLSEYHMVIVPEESKFDGIGTGAWSLESFEPGVRARVKRYANDWQADRGYVASVETLHIGDPTARISAVLSGAAHIVNRLAPNSVEPLKDNPNIQIFSATGGNHSILTMGCDRPPFGNSLDLRLAVKYAIDREAVLKTAFRGYGKIGNDHPVPEGMNMYAADIPQRKYDPDKAKFHAKKSGYTDPIVLAASSGAFQGGMEVAQIYLSNAQAAGLNFQIKQLPSEGYFTSYMDNSFFESTFGGRPTADLALAVEFGTNSPLNESKWSNPKFDQLLIAARAETDAAKRKQMYHDLQFMVHEEAGSVIPIFTTTMEAAAKTVKGYVSSPVQQMGAWRAIQKVWLDNA